MNQESTFYVLTYAQNWFMDIMIIILDHLAVVKHSETTCWCSHGSPIGITAGLFVTAHRWERLPPARTAPGDPSRHPAAPQWTQPQTWLDLDKSFPRCQPSKTSQNMTIYIYIIYIYIYMYMCVCVSMYIHTQSTIHFWDNVAKPRHPWLGHGQHTIPAARDRWVGRGLRNTILAAVPAEVGPNASGTGDVVGQRWRWEQNARNGDFIGF